MTWMEVADNALAAIVIIAFLWFAHKAATHK